MRILILFIAYLVFPSCQFAQPPAKVLHSFQKKYPAAKEVSWNIDRNERHEADFSLNGIHYRADFNSDGAWVETERSVDWKDLPEATKAAFLSEDTKKDVIEIELVEHHQQGEFYDIEYKTGNGKQDIRITAAGKVLGTDKH
ncbi:MAG: PepSY-like domain-containing protein [Saprospiraceae bacterium]|nr:PepSY-like domain-containing protein [Saprospiraceae bacterium]